MPDLRKEMVAESTARHGVVVFLLFFILIELYNSSVPAKDQLKVGAAWTGWGITFILLAFFFIIPELEAKVLAAG